MKKLLISSMVFATMIFAFSPLANVSAVGIGSQSRDVTVGEVDEININDENPDASTPDTGLFGLEASSASAVLATLLIIPTIVILACFSKRIHRRRTK